MLRFTLRQLRMSLRQIAGGAMAIVVATGFVAAAMAGSSVLDRTVANIMMEPYAGADLVVGKIDFDDTQNLPTTAADDALALDAVQDAFLPIATSGDMSAGDRTEWVRLRTLSAAPEFATWPVMTGREPVRSGEASLASSLAQRLRVGIGDEVEFSVWSVPIGTTTVSVATQSDGADARADETEGGEAPEQTASAQGNSSPPPEASAENEAAASADPVEEVAIYAEPELKTVLLTVTGLFDDSVTTFATGRPSVLTPMATLEELGLFGEVSPDYQPGALMLELGPQAEDSPLIRQQIFESLAAAWSGSTWAAECPEGLALQTSPARWQLGQTSACEMLVMTPEQAASVRGAANQSYIVKIVAIIFGLVALLTGAMVIANTFQVMIAGRTRTLALLRAVGATRRQVRRSVLLEALMIGLIASAAGVAAGWGLIQAAMMVAGRFYPSVPLPTRVSMAPLAILAAMLIGTGTTVVASLIPARLATRVAPIDALRPQTAPSLSVAAGRKRLVWSVVLAGSGAAIMALALWLANALGEEANVYLLGGGAVAGVLGGALLAAGVILGSVFWLPKVAGRIAAGLAHGRGGARVAAANVVRNPRRTAASATALMVGVTLVSSMLVAAAGVNHSAETYFEERRPVDLAIGSARTGSTLSDDLVGEDSAYLIGEAVPADLVAQIEAVPGVTDATPIKATVIEVPDDSGVPVSYVINGVDPQLLRGTLGRPALADQLEPNVVLVDSWTNDQLSQMSVILYGNQTDAEGNVVEPSPDPVSGATRLAVTGEGETVELTFVYSPELDDYGVWSASLMADSATLDALGGGETVAALFNVDNDADPIAVQNEVLELVTDASPEATTAYPVEGAAVEKAEARKALDTMLLIGLALLAVSLVVALIGISNTLSLSVIERRRETAVLRALGLTRGQTRWMLAIEAAVIAGVAGLMGVFFGTLYGFAACGLLLGPTVGLSLVFPGWALAVLFGLILSAGLLASVLPGRRASRTPPAAALAID
ncbi:MAG: ABC transporter permease [Bifidobacteriaceae bacterium]|jgi:putative ABC transport system permease protein|nr:ABC transporter permease [Bifidobacteriaceae bacterium]